MFAVFPKCFRLWLVPIFFLVKAFIGGGKHCNYPEGGNSGAARTLVTEVRLAVEGPLAELAHSQNEN